MRNIILYHGAVILGILSSLTKAEYSSSGSNKDGFGKKSGYDNSYNGYLGDYAGHLSGGKALGELHHGFSESSQIAPEHGSQFDEGESHDFSDSFGEQNDDEDNSHYDRYSGSFESLKFPQDVEAQHYTGGSSSSDIGGGDEDNHQHHHHHHHHHEQHDFESHNHNYQFDEPAKSSDFKGYHSFEGAQIVPYSGNEEAEQHEEEPPQYSGYEHSQENEIPKGPSKSYEGLSSKPPASSYIHNYEGAKSSAGSSNSHSYESAKAPAPGSYSHSFEPPKTPSSSSYSSSYEASKEPSSSYESIKTPSLSHEPSLGSYGIKYQHPQAQEAPSKLDVVHKYKSSGLKAFHAPQLQKNVMTINHGKGGYSFSSLYRH